MGLKTLKEIQSNRMLKKNILREHILNFEKELIEVPNAFIGDSDYCPLKHSFTENMYVREIFIPKGTFIVGKIHKHEHPNFLLKGTVDIVTEECVERLKAPKSIISPSGTKRALKAITDIVWVTVHHNPTNTHNLKKIEKEVIADSYKEYDLFITKKNSFLNKLRNTLTNILSL